MLGRLLIPTLIQYLIHLVRIVLVLRLHQVRRCLRGRVVVLLRVNLGLCHLDAREIGRCLEKDLVDLVAGFRAAQVAVHLTLLSELVVEVCVNLREVVQIMLVPQQYFDGLIIGVEVVLRLVYANLLEPRVNILQSFQIGDVVNVDDRVCVVDVGLEHLAGECRAVDVPELE